MLHAGKKEEAEWPEKYDIEKKRITGFIAQDVEKAAKDAGYDFQGVEAPKNADGLYSLRYADFVVPFVIAMQEQQKTIELLQERISNLENIILGLKK